MDEFQNKRYKKIFLTKISIAIQATADIIYFYIEKCTYIHFFIIKADVDIGELVGDYFSFFFI